MIITQLKLNIMNIYGDEYKKWEKSETKDGITKTMTVMQVENGYIIKYCKVTEKDGAYEEEKKCFISHSNPMETKKEDIKEDMNTLDALSKIGL